MCLGALGSQTGGSIIRPASFCGVAGFKPPYKFLADEGIHPLAPAFDHPGPIARTIRDLQLIMYDLVVFEDETLETISDMPLASQETVETTIKEIDQPREKPPRLLRPRGFFDRRAEPIMLEAFERALERLAEAGAEVIEKDDPFDFEAMLTDHRLIMAAQAAAVHEMVFTGQSHGEEGRLTEFRDDYAPHIRSLIEEGFTVPITRYIRAKLKLDGFEEHFDQEIEGIDALVTPATIGPAPDARTTGNPCFNTPFSYLGWPAASFPIDLSPEGLPLAIQMAGSNGFYVKPNNLLQTAAWSEAVIRRASRLGGGSNPP
jgi:aspartyl-tRNA(Asn)/glutamyl-tRNA(Gln) amidotransferase subunit A